MSDLPRPQVLQDVVEEHFEELDYLWEQRENSVFAPDWFPAELARWESRAEGHILGLRAGGEPARALALRALEDPEPSAVTAAILFLGGLEDDDLDAVLLGCLREAPPEVLPGCVTGFRHALRDGRRWEPELRRILAEGSPAARVAALDVLAFHRLKGKRGVPELYAELDPHLRIRSLPALGRIPGCWSRDDLVALLDAESPATILLGLRVSALQGVPQLAEFCRGVAVRRGPGTEACLHFLGVLGEPDDVQLLLDAAGDSAWRGGALAGMGALGNPAAVPFLLDLLEEDETAAAAGEAFVRITGATHLDREAPVPPPDDIPEEERDFWPDLYPPDPEGARRWWAGEQGRFQGTRFQAGLNVDSLALDEALQVLPLAARRDLYQRMRYRQPEETPDLELERRLRWQAVPAGA